MFWLGLLLPVCFIPSITGVSIPTQWIVLSCILPLGLWRKSPLTPLHWLGAAFLAWAFASVLWSIDRSQSVWGLWLLSISALTFWLGSTLDSPRALYKGLACGLSASSVVCVLQVTDHWPLMHFSTGPTGLLFNSMYLGEAVALCIVALVTERLWWYIPGLLPALFLANSRGAYLALALGLFAVWFRRPLWLLAGALAFGLIWSTHPGSSDLERLHIWSIATKLLSWHGLGAGAFSDVVYVVSGHAIVVPEYVHNDYLQLAVEYGIGAGLLYAFVALALSQTSAQGWPLFLTFTAMALWSFPSEMPLTLFIGACAAGGIARDWALSGLSGVDSGYAFLPWATRTQSGLSGSRPVDLPLEPRAT